MNLRGLLHTHNAHLDVTLTDAVTVLSSCIIYNLGVGCSCLLWWALHSEQFLYVSTSYLSVGVIVIATAMGGA